MKPYHNLSKRERQKRTTYRNHGKGKEIERLWDVGIRGSWRNPLTIIMKLELSIQVLVFEHTYIAWEALPFVNTLIINPRYIPLRLLVAVPPIVTLPSTIWIYMKQGVAPGSYSSIPKPRTWGSFRLGYGGQRMRGDLHFTWCIRVSPDLRCGGLGVVFLATTMVLRSGGRPITPSTFHNTFSIAEGSYRTRPQQRALITPHYGPVKSRSVHSIRKWEGAFNHRIQQRARAFLRPFVFAQAQ